MNRNALMIIIVAALGYFVDIYDLILFNVVKKESLIFLMPGADPKEISSTGMFLFNMQMLGMLAGGFLWGIWGDKRGRVSVLFGSILLYSVANIANAFITDITFYAAIRVIAGIGLAGELGAGITLVSETMSKEKRGIGTMIIVSFGALGAVVAALVGTEGELIGNLLSNIIGRPLMNWQVAYIVGGLLGLLLLLLRIGIYESGMFKHAQHSDVEKGNFLLLFKNRENFVKYLRCILVGLPIWYTIGILVANSEELFSKEFGVSGRVVNGMAVMYCYIGLSVGDVFSGLISQMLRSRRKVVMIYLAMTSIVVLWFLLFSRGITPNAYYVLTFVIGFAAGYWAIFVTIASEQFGTNIRSTVTNTVPNFVRGSVPICAGIFHFLSPYTGNIYSALVVGALCIGLSFWSIVGLKESFSKDLDYFEK